MALGVSAIVEVRQAGSDTNGGMFDPSLNINSFATNLAATSANTSAPVVTSATYNFVAGDVGAYLYIAGGTNWLKGFYKIASVAANAATLSAACATVASPTTGTWSVDYSQQNSAQFAFTDMTAGGAGSTFTSAGHPVGPNFVGNVIDVTGGTNVTTGRFQVISTSGTTATVDRALTTGATSNGAGNLGGALLTPKTATGLMPSGSQVKCWIMGGVGAAVYSQTASGTSTGGGNAQNAALAQQVNGYSVARGDIHMQADGSYSNNTGRPVIQLSTNTGLTALLSALYTIFRNIIVDCNGLGTSIGINLGSNCVSTNCKVKNFTNRGYVCGSNTLLENCEVCYGTNGTAILSNGQGPQCYGCYIHDNNTASAQIGVYGGNCNGLYIGYCILVNNGGATGDGIQIASMENGVVVNNVIVNSGRHAFNGGTNNDETVMIVKNNIFGRSGGYGMQISTAAGSPASSVCDGNVYWLNTSGTRHFADDGDINFSQTNLINLDNRYTNVRDITLTADDAHNPFVRYGISGSTYSATDLASTNGTNATPTVTSATYTFVTSDIGSTIQITTQTGNWLENTYRITGVSGGGAILDKPCATAASVSGATYYFNDFRLNNTAGAGASCRAAAAPGIPGGYPPSYAGGSLDMGAMQHADPVASGGAVGNNMHGGFCN